MGGKGSTTGRKGGDDGSKAEPKLRRSKSISVDAKAAKGLRKTKSAVYDPDDLDGNGAPSPEKLTRRTSVVANKRGAPMALPVPEILHADQPKITVGVDTHIGDAASHPNEDRATAVLDLLGKFAPKGKEYKGDDDKMVSFFGVYDGHGGSSCSEWLCKNLHVEVAKRTRASTSFWTHASLYLLLYFKPAPPPHAPCAMLYLVAMRTEC